MKELSTEIEIKAPAARVWQILTDQDALAEWNSFIPSMDGQLQEGSQLVVKMTPPKGMAMTFRPTVLKVEEERELRWLGRLLMPGIFDGEHSFLIEPSGNDAVKFSQREKFSGILVPLMGLIGVFRNTNDGFEQMNEALKQRAESDPLQ